MQVAVNGPDISPPESLLVPEYVPLRDFPGQGENEAALIVSLVEARVQGRTSHGAGHLAAAVVPRVWPRHRGAGLVRIMFPEISPRAQVPLHVSAALAAATCAVEPAMMSATSQCRTFKPTMAGEYLPDGRRLSTAESGLSHHDADGRISHGAGDPQRRGLRDVRLEAQQQPALAPQRACWWPAAACSPGSAPCASRYMTTCGCPRSSSRARRSRSRARRGSGPERLLEERDRLLSTELGDQHAAPGTRPAGRRGR